MSTTPEPLLWEEIDALVARARKYEPHLVGSKVDFDQCVPIAAELCLRLPRGSLPKIEVNAENRFERWEQRLAQEGYAVESLELEQLPPEDGLPWVATVRVDERSNHAIAMLGVGLATIDALEHYRPRSLANVIDAWRPVQTT